MRQVYKTVLANGLRVVVAPQHQAPKVSVQLWYNVGSKDELTGEKGIAHLIEHMIFKGTQRLSESDINQITYKLSGYCNAFTSHDYTGYLFDFPSQNWHQALPIMADCMRNCTFREEFLNSELKAVVQELKMYRDDYMSSMIERMMGTIFADHPYHYPVIGYKQDLWSLKRDDLVAFYERHYIPNNATLVVVGDVKPEEVFERAEERFGGIAADLNYKKEKFYHAADLEATRIALMREIQQSQGIIAWEVPGVVERKDFVLDVASWIIGSGKGSRLYHRIVDELELATDIESFTYDLFEHGLFFVSFQPRAGIAAETVVAAISEEIDHIARDGVREEEIQRALKKTAMDCVSLREDNQKYAYLIGKYMTALDDENYCVNYMNQIPPQEVARNVHELVATHLRPAVSHQGILVPLVDRERAYWIAQQERSDAEDNRILSRITRECEVEAGSHVACVESGKRPEFAFPEPQQFVLRNGLTVLWHHNPHLPTVDVILELKVKHYFDPENKQGLSLFLFDMLQEGTTRYSAQAFAQELERYGMSLSTVPGLISLKALSSDIQRGLLLLGELLQHATINPVSVEKVRQRIIADVRAFWDSPMKIATQLMREALYQAHPYHRAILGTEQSISSITREELYDAYRRWITPQGSCISIAGDLEGLDIVSLLEETVGSWQGPQVVDMLFPAVNLVMPPPNRQYVIQRDQIALAFGRVSVDRWSNDFDKLLLFDQVFTGGFLGAMNSRLFALREQSGLFYTIGGSLVAGVGKQPGLAFIKTIVSPDRLAEAEGAIKRVIDGGADELTHTELEEAQRAVITSIVDTFATNRQTAAAFLFLHEYGLPSSYFATRAEKIETITREEVQEAASKLLQADTYATVRVGRV